MRQSRWATGHLNELRLRVYRDKGGLEVVHRSDGSELKACIGTNVETATWETIDAGTVPTNYDRFVDALRTGKKSEPSFRYAANLQKILDLAMVTEEKRQEMAV